ncbi:tetraacyldisaccharide 4'-kinase [Leptospira sp. 96542]|nr:tetraacyldisaccharide 4'-kinase [Leptospira sp. 96542]
MVRFFLYLFSPFSWLYQFIFWIHQTSIIQREIPDVLTISVGNLTVGGTGKTPFVQYLVRFFNEFHPEYKVTILSRGYKAKYSEAGAILPKNPDPILYGDEPCLHKNKFQNIQVIIGKDRLKSFTDWNEFKDKKHIVILDDGFQHKYIARNLDIVLLDANNPIGNGFTIPLGYLREPLANLKRSDLVIFTKESESNLNFVRKLELKIKKIKYTKPIFHSSFLPESVQSLDVNELHLVTGVGNPSDVLRTMKQVFPGILLKKTYFPDHYDYTIKDIQKILQNTNGHLITTEKDWVKMQCLEGLQELLDHFQKKIIVLGITVSIQNEDSFFTILNDLVSTYESKIDQV